MRRRTRIFCMVGMAVFALYLANASWLAAQPDGDVKLYAHRGVHQPYDRAGLTDSTCTAARILEPTHDYLENTVASMAAAFAAGADKVEIDIYRTKDANWAVFHDVRLECRTDGEGRVRDHTMAYLKTLDIGHGYTADGGATHPFRGRFVGAMPSLSEVLDRFPEEAFDLHVKGGRAADATALWAELERRSVADRARLSVFSTPQFDTAWQALDTGIAFNGKHRVKACLTHYMLTGWAGHVPDACEGGMMVPVDVAPLVWGWPDRLQARFADVRGGVTLIGPLREVDGSRAIDTTEALARVPEDWSGWLYTNRIEWVGPALAERSLGSD